MEININRIIKRLNALYDLGLQEDGTHTRMAFSKEDQKGRELFSEYFAKLDIPVRTDEAGNLIARMDGMNKEAPAILIGSHLDTVPDGGKYDGVLGCLAGLEICEVLKENGVTTKHPIEVIVFSDEEGFRFGSGLIGSSALCGENLNINASDLDIYGNQRGNVLQEVGIDISKIANAQRSSSDVKYFIEMHIEQGQTLDKLNIPIGIVSTIAGVSRYEVNIYGQANHAGSTRMQDRNDALVKASTIIGKIPEIVDSEGNEYTVATVGTIKVIPNSVNVIPGQCIFNLEIRDQNEAIIKNIEAKVEDLLKQYCGEKESGFTYKLLSYHPPAPMDKEIQQAIEDVAIQMNEKYIKVPSGAFHDSLIMTKKFKTGMIFVPSVNGISHSKEEYTTDLDIEKGCNVLLNTILLLDQK